MPHLFFLRERESAHARAGGGVGTEDRISSILSVGHRAGGEA